MRGVAAAGGAAAVGVSLDPVERSEAITPSAFGPLGDLAAHGAGVALGWALREYTVLGADGPADGLSADALLDQVYQTLLTRQSTNASTIVDNQNIVNLGLSNTLYVEGKLAAIEALNAGETQSNVETAAISALEGYATTIESNLLKTWHESINEFELTLQSIEDHPDTVINDFLDDDWHTGGGSSHGFNDFAFPETTITLTDGSTLTIKRLKHDTHGGNDVMRWDPTAESSSNYDTVDHRRMSVEVEPHDVFHYLDFYKWNDIWTNIQNTITSVNDGLILWIDSIYGQVQSGEIAVEDLITPRERAAMMTDDGKYPQAVADLLALNVPVNFEREATVSLDYLSQDVSLKGTLGITSPPDSLTPGTYSPSGDNLGSVYLTYDVGSGVGYWTQYDDAKGVDGGIVEFEAEPLDGVTYAITTNYDETAEVTVSDFTKGTDGSSNTVWTVDVSGQLDNSIAEISEIQFYTPTDETRYETIQLEGQFTIEKFTNRETGEEVDSAGFENSEPQDDTNYVTQEEWDNLQAQNERLIDLYEESQDDGGTGGGGGNGDDEPSILDQSYYGIPALGWVGGGLVTLAAIASRGN
ncbi:hypothetical protein KY092_11405 [Natronomonas gomsonensis]|nr:hypothetical protein [Natronomonas gomsonensis]